MRLLDYACGTGLVSRVCLPFSNFVLDGCAKVEEIGIGALRDPIPGN